MSMYKNIYGLTCIENHVLALLRMHGIEERFFYCDSYILASDLYEQIINKGNAFDYQGIIRVQNLCKDLGIISLNKRVGDVIAAIKKRNTILMQVTPDFNKSVLGARGYRNDHYVIAQMSEDIISIINDIPQKRIVTDYEMLQTAYAGEYFEFELLRTLNNNDKTFCLERWKNSINKPFKKLNIDEVLSNDTNENILRDYLLLLKVLRKRCLGFCDACGFPLGANDLCNKYEGIFTKYEYYFIRKSICSSFIKDIITEINILEKMFFDCIKVHIK